MIVTALQLSPTEDAGGMIAAHSGSDLYVLPEMWTTGFTVEPQEAAEPESQAAERMRRLAAQQNAAVAGSIAVKIEDSTGREKENAEYFNRFYFAEPDGRLSHYDKHHLFTLGGEHRHYQAGRERTVVCYGGVRFMLLTCYDLRFPVWSRSRSDYDCILYVANWPTLRIEAWRTLLRARAIENQCYVVGVNRVSPELTTIKGQQGVRLFGGRSAIISPDGAVLAEGSADKEEAVTARLDMGTLTKLRKKFPVLHDRDEFMLMN